MQIITTHLASANATLRTRPLGTRTIRVRSTGSPVSRKVVLSLVVLLAAVSGLVAGPPHVEWATGSQAAYLGGSASFMASCTSDAGAMTYQWYRNREPLEDRTSGRLLLSNLQAGDEGDYTLRVTNSDGSVETEPARLYVVRPIGDLAVGEVTDDNGLSLPYLYNLPESYDPSKSYPMYILLWGFGPLGFDRLTDDIRVFPWATILRSYGIEASHPSVLVFPARRPGALTWEQPDYPLLLGMIDQLAEAFSINLNRVHLIGFSDGGRTAWALTGQRPGAFASITTWATTGNPPDPRAVNPLPAWLFCGGDDGLVGNNRNAVSRLLVAGYRPIYTEYRAGGHTVQVIDWALCNPAFVDWWLDQERDVASAKQPLVSIVQPTSEEIYVTSRMTASLEGTAHARDQQVRQVKWSNLTAGTEGLAQGADLWSAAGIPLVPDQTNLIVMTATTTSWSGTAPGETRFHDTLTVLCQPFRATLERQGPEATLSWANGEGPFTVQRAAALDPAAWTDFLPNAVAPVALPLEGPSGFYRVIGK